MGKNNINYKLKIYSHGVEEQEWDGSTGEEDREEEERLSAPGIREGSN